MRFLIVRRSDGSGGLDESLLDYYMRDLNYGFRDTPFVFVQLPEITYIDSDVHFANIPDWPTAISLMNAHHQPGVVNHIVTPTTFGGPPVTGLNFVSNPRGNIVAYERIGHPHSIVFPPHEMGHVFWLYHPYESQFGAQCTSEANCLNVGDLVCDTPASPVVHGGNTTATGIFYSEIPGPCAGDPLFSPLTDLYMEAGWPAGHILRDRFTPEQTQRMENTLLTVSPDLIGAQRPDVLVDCDGNGLDDVEEILAGNKPDNGRDLVPDGCQVFPRPDDLLVAGMNSDVLNRVRFFDGATGSFRETMWNGMNWVHQMRLGPDDGLVYLTTLTVVQRMDLTTGRTVDNFIDGVLEGAGTFVDLLFEDSGHILVLDNVSANIRQYNGNSGDFMGVFANVIGAGMSSPKYMAFGPDGHIYVVGNGALGNTVQRFNGQTGASLGAFVSAGSGGLQSGQGILFHDGRLYVSNGAGNGVLRYDATSGAFVDAFVSPGSGGLANPHSLRFGPDGNLYVASRNTHSVKRYHGTTGAYLGDFVASGTNGLVQPTGLLFVPSAETCETLPPPGYGDANHDGAVDVFDILCVLDGFAGEFETCTLEDVDLSPCAAPDGTVDVFDVLAILDAFAGTACCDS